MSVGGGPDSTSEGLVVLDERRADRIIASAASRFRMRSEQELAGDRDALDHVWQADWETDSRPASCCTCTDWPEQC